MVIFTGSRTSRIVAIAVGSSVGGSLIVLLLLVALIAIVITCLSSQKWKVHNSSSSPMPVVKPSNEKVITESNIAYKSVQHAETINAGEEMTQCHGSGKQSSGQNWDSKLDMEQNMAYESSSAAQISCSTKINVAYYKSGRQLEENVYEIDGLDEYDYISRP